MANSRNPTRAEDSAGLIDKIAQRIGACAALAASGKGLVMALALSGGRDSAALLHACAAWRDAARAPVRLVALHVHHGLQADADAWQAACARMARACGVPFYARRVRVATEAGFGVEAAARQARYTALIALCAELGAAALLTAHHQDDQAETVLLQLLRGAGLDGLSAMPVARAAGVALLRPWLDVPRASIEAYACRHGLTWVEDSSNCDARYARNALRPLLAGMAGHFPAYRAALARSAAHLAEAAALIDDIAQADLARVAPAGVLAAAAWAALSEPRQRAVLRAWLAAAGVRAPSARRLEDLRGQLLGARADGALCVRFPGGWVRRYRGLATIEAPGSADAAPGPWHIAADRFDPERRVCQRVEAAEWGGALLFSPTPSDGVGAPILRAPLRLRERPCGARIVLRSGGPSRALKQAYQEAGVPAWARPRLPLLYAGDRLVFAAGLGVDQSAIGAGPGWRIAWQAADAPVG